MPYPLPYKNVKFTNKLTGEPLQSLNSSKQAMYCQPWQSVTNECKIRAIEKY